MQEETSPKQIRTDRPDPIATLARHARSTWASRPFIAATIDRLRNLRGDKGNLYPSCASATSPPGNLPTRNLAEVILLLRECDPPEPAKFRSAHQLLASAAASRTAHIPKLSRNSLWLPTSPRTIQQSLLATHLGSTHPAQLQPRSPYIDHASRKAKPPLSDSAVSAPPSGRGRAILPQPYKVRTSPPANQDNDKIGLTAPSIAQLNQNAKAEALLTELLKQPTPEAIQLTANLYGAQKREVDAQRALAMLDNLDCTLAIRSRIRAGYAARFGSSDDAIKQYLALTKMTPTDPTAWRQLLAICIFSGRFDDVDRYVGEACTSVPGDNGFTTLRENIALLHKFGDVPSFRQVFASMAQSPKDAARIADALNLFSNVVSQQPASQESAAKLRQAAQTSDLLAVQLIGVRGLTIAGRNDDAIEIASQAMTAFPNSVESAEAATQALVAGKRWNEAL